MFSKANGKTFLSDDFQIGKVNLLSDLWKQIIATFSWMNEDHRGYLKHTTCVQLFDYANVYQTCQNLKSFSIWSPGE